MRRLLIVLAAVGALATAAPANAQLIGDTGSLARPGQRPLPPDVAARTVLTPQDAIPGLETGTGDASWLRDGMAAGRQVWITNSQWNGTGGGCSIRDYFVC
jgi:hypothetical protein